MLYFYGGETDNAVAETAIFWDVSQSGYGAEGSGRDGVGRRFWGDLFKSFSNTQTLYAGVAFLPPSTGGVPIRFRDAGTIQLDIIVNSDWSISVRRNGTVLATSAINTIASNVWNYIELGVTIADSGSYEVRLNGSSTAILSGSADTQATANAYANQVGFITGGSWKFDDFYVNDTGFLGDVYVKFVQPNGAGNSTQWTASAGSNYQCVDDSLPYNDDTDYVSDGTVGHKDAYTTADLSNYSILACQTFMRARKDDAGTRQVRSYLRSGTTDFTESTQTLSVSYINYYGSIRTVDPNTSAAWTLSNFNSCQIGVEVVA